MDPNEPSEQAPPQPAPFPRTTINITANGVQISVELAPGLAIAQTLPEDVVNKICAEWIKSRKEIATQIATQQHIIDQVRRSKLH